MKPDFFFDKGHADFYLRNSIIRIGKAPIYVTEVFVHLGIKLFYTPITDINSSPKSISLKDDDINLSPPELGFINLLRFNTPKVYKAFRIPTQLSKVGLTTDNIQFYPNTPTLLYSKAMYDCIIGDYPKYEEVLNRIKKDKNSFCAFSRRFAISINEVLFTQLDEPIGKLYKDEISLFPQYTYLSELLEEDLK